MRAMLLFAALVFAAGLSGGCAKKITLPASTDLPAATGEAKVTKDDNGNTRVNLKVKHFAPPQRLQPPRQVYVVWIETPQQVMYNVGQLRVNDNLEGELEAVTPYQVFRLVITAEDYPTVTTPGPQVILSTKVIDRDR